MNVIFNNKHVSMEYIDICMDLGFIPETRFVKVTNRGTITFTVGKPYEIKALYKSVIDHGYKPSGKLVKCVKNN